VQERCDLPGLETKLAAEQLEIAPALFDHVVSVGVAEGHLVRTGAFVRLSSHTPSLGADAPLGRAVVEALRKAGASPPGLEELGRITRATAERLARTCDFLARSGQIVQVASGMYFDASLVAGAREHIVAELRATGELQTQSLKVFLGCTRKHLMPLLEYFDRMKVTRRDGERRIAGESAIAEVAP
jgi:selenocysteine-specific elongation factor